MSDNEESGSAAVQSLRILSYNVQVGIKTSRPRHYLTGSWKHLLPHSQRLTNLDLAAHKMHGFDIVGLQEVDAGSIRSNFINLAEYLAVRAEFPYWHHQVNRNLGRIAQHSNGLLSHYHPDAIVDLKLPGLIPGRQAIMARFDSGDDTLVVLVVHLALSKRARLAQFEYISDVVNSYPHAIVMGDMNCHFNSPEMQLLFSKTRLHEPLEELHTFPSWKPQFNIDHILVTSELKVTTAKVVEHSGSDHLPIMMEIELPEKMQLHRYSHQSHSFDSYMRNIKL